MDKNQNDVSTQSTTPASEPPTAERTPLGVWAMVAIFGFGLIALIVMSNIDF